MWHLRAGAVGEPYCGRMRSEWVPISAAALVTGVMALVLAQMLNPGGSETSPAAQVEVIAEYPGRWLAMSILFFGGAASLVLGMPAVMVLFQDRRGRGVGMIGVAVFTVGCVGVGALAGLMLMFRALAVEALKSGDARSDIGLVTAALEETGLVVTLGFWVYGFILGVALIAIGLFRSRRTPAWVPALFGAFLAMQVLMPLLDEGTAPARVASAVALVLLAAGFTGVATTAATVSGAGTLTRSLV